MIHVCEHHDELLTIWRDERAREIRLAHVDFHDDLRGLLIDRSGGRAWPLDALARGEAPEDAGNFLAHAVVQGLVRRVRWIHDTIGGRAWDMGIVRYDSDLLAWPLRRRIARAATPAVPLDFEELLLDRWQGLELGERLSIDWDCFASILQPVEGIANRVERFLERLGDHEPTEVYVVYSPEYCHPTLEAFAELVERLQHRFDQPVRWHSTDLELGRTRPTGVDAGLPSDPLSRLVLFLRRRGIY